MKLLFLTRNFAADDPIGATLYSRQVFEFLSGAGLSMTVLSCSLAPSLNESNPAFQLHRYTPGATTVMQRVLLPRSASSCGGSEAVRRLGEVFSSQKFDAVVFDHCAMLWAVEPIARLDPRREVRRIYVAHNDEIASRLRIARCESSHPVEYAAQMFEALRTARLIDSVQAAIDALILIAPGEQAQSGRFKHAGKFHFPPMIVSNQEKLTKVTASSGRRGHVLHYGSLTWRTKRRNLLRFLGEWGRAEAFRQLDLTVAGRMDAALAGRLRRDFPWTRVMPDIAMQEIVEAAPPSAGVVIDDAGGGFKMKLLDYVAFGLPVFALRQAVEGSLDEHRLQALARFDSLPSLVAGLMQAHQDGALLKELAQRSRDTLRPVMSGDTGRAQAAALRQWLAGDAAC